MTSTDDVVDVIANGGSIRPISTRGESVTIVVWWWVAKHFIQTNMELLLKFVLAARYVSNLMNR